MKKIYFLIYSFLILHSSSFAQGTWTWISGSSLNQTSVAQVLGTKGMPSKNNHPSSTYEGAEWKDKQGNFWIYGIWDLNVAGFYSDLWKFNPATLEWTWVKGSGLAGQTPVYGTKGVPSLSNSPGYRGWAPETWVDSSGALWLFGGCTISYGYGGENDLWKYDIGTNEWTWMSGSNVTVTPVKATQEAVIGVYGTKGVPSPSNVPGGRKESCSSWVDGSNNLWLFGGGGFDENDSLGYLNDLWKYNIGTNEWTWMNGSPVVNSLGNYGTMGVADTSNEPQGRQTYTKWKDAQCNFWLMGGMYWTSFSHYLNDLWKYDPIANEWTWMGGTSVANDLGNYHSNCTFDSLNEPYSRLEHRSSVTDNCGRFWLYGGANPQGKFNDLWVFNPQQLKWNWVSGSNNLNEPGTYGTEGLPSAFNLPPNRMGALAWWGNDNKFYMYGGNSVVGLTNNVLADVWVFDPDTTCVSPSTCNVQGTCAVVNIPPVANFESSEKNICANDCLNYTNLSTNATSWQWTFSGALDSTSTVQNPQNVCYAKAGTFNVTLTASNTSGSKTVTFSNYITVAQSPPAPHIIQHHDTLYCSTNPAYTSYQWSSNNTVIPGAIDTFLVVSQSGDYNLLVKNENGCSIGAGINVILGIQNYSNDNLISIYPNPATDEFLISGNWKSENGNLKLSIFNILGEVIYTEAVTGKQETINCKPFSAGIYFVQVANDSGRWIGRFVKE